MIDQKMMMGFYRGGVAGASLYILSSIYDYITHLQQDLQDKNDILSKENKYFKDENDYLKDEINKKMIEIESKDTIINKLNKEIRKRKASDKIIIEYEDAS
jgi:hypothetical protein